MVISNHVSGQSNFIFPCDHHIFHHISPLRKPRKFSFRIHACEKSREWACDVKMINSTKNRFKSFLYQKTVKERKNLLIYKTWKTIRIRCIINYQLSFGIINDLMHERSGDTNTCMKIYYPRKIIFPLGFALGKYDFPWRNKSSYLPHRHAINV